MAYFDHNATTPLAPVAREAWLRAVDEAWENPSSPYRSAARVRNLFDEARCRLGESLDCSPKRIVFNSGATEGINAIFSYCASRSDLFRLAVLLSPVEHPSVLAAAQLHFPGNIRFCEVDSLGRIDVDSVKTLLRQKRFALVSIMAANNETGILHPWSEIAEVCRSAGVFYLCDATQWIGKLPAADIGHVDFLTASAHKFGGPKGCGFLTFPAAASGFHGQVGGEQEHGFRAGTEDYPSVAAMLAALLENATQLRLPDEIATRLTWRTSFEEAIESRLPGLRIAGREADRLWNTVPMILPLGTNDRWVRKLDRAGFQVSTGSACATGKEGPSHVLAAFGFSAKEAKRSLRVSSCWETSRKDWIQLGEALESVYRELKEDDGNGDRLTEVIRI